MSRSPRWHLQQHQGGVLDAHLPLTQRRSVLTEVCQPEPNTIVAAGDQTGSMSKETWTSRSHAHLTYPPHTTLPGQEHKGGIWSC